MQVDAIASGFQENVLKLIQSVIVYKLGYLRSCTKLNKGLPKEQKGERKGVSNICGRLWKPSLNTPKG
jgi:hypothetical protein